jgi:molecular chaperone GrpE
MNSRDWRTLRHLGRDPVVPLAVAERVAHERDQLEALLGRAENELRSQRSALASRTEEARRLQHSVEVLQGQARAAVSRAEQLEQALSRVEPAPRADIGRELRDELERSRNEAQVFREDAHRGWAQVERAQAEAREARQEADRARDELEALRQSAAAAATPRASTATQAAESEHEALEWKRRATGYAADLANLRRREAAEIEAGVRRERVARLMGLATVHDTVQRSIDTSTMNHDDPWMQGTIRTRELVLQQMAAAGAQPFGAAGDRFDPHRHEAIAVLPGGEADTVAQVLEVGFSLDDGSLVRPARVAVHNGKTVQ